MIPTSLKIKPPVTMREGYKIAKRASRSFLSACIRETYKKKCELDNRISTVPVRMEIELSTHDYQKVMQLSHTAADKTNAKTKLNQLQKLGKLIQHQDKKIELHPQGLDRWVVNLTNRHLTPSQEGVLKLGLNFAPAPTKFRLIDIVAAVDKGARKLKGMEAEDLCEWVRGILRHAKLPKDDLTKEQRKALKELRQIDELILLADKGNATVLMTRENYDTKMRGMIETATYRRLGKDPTITQENRISRKLKDLEKCEELPSTLYSRLRPSECQVPRIYGLPKVHKTGVPLRPIVTCIGFPSYKLSQHIAPL